MSMKKSRETSLDLMWISSNQVNLSTVLTSYLKQACDYLKQGIVFTVPACFRYENETRGERHFVIFQINL